MTRTQEREPKSRQRIASEKMTSVQQICRAVQSGPVKSELRTVQESIHAARALAMQIESMMTDPKYITRDLAEHHVYGTDYHVAIAYMTPDLSTLFTWPYEPGKESEIHARLSGVGSCSIVVGLVFGMRDPERGGAEYYGGKVFLDTPLVRMALAQRMKENSGKQFQG